MEINDLLPVLKKVFPDLENIHNELNKDDVPEWDSINHLNLIIELEDEFNVSFSSDEIQEINSIEKILRFINLKQ
jgi:acyl carrier protein